VNSTSSAEADTAHGQAVSPSCRTRLGDRPISISREKTDNSSVCRCAFVTVGMKDQPTGGPADSRMNMQQVLRYPLRRCTPRSHAGGIGDGCPPATDAPGGLPLQSPSVSSTCRTRHQSTTRPRRGKGSGSIAFGGVAGPPELACRHHRSKREPRLTSTAGYRDYARRQYRYDVFIEFPRPA